MNKAINVSPDGGILAKISYLDHLKILLTVLVILHHSFIAYGAPGDWYFKQPTTQPLARILMTLFVATNQSFFMGFFFMLSAYFIEPSYQRKGPAVFSVDRLKRLGIPLAFYSFLLSPCMNFLVYRFGQHKSATFWQYLSGYDAWISFGVMWFVAALLLFTFLYLLLRPLVTLPEGLTLPTSGVIVLFGAALGGLSFLVRFWFPIGWVLHPVGFQLGHFPQYLAYFVLGIVARQNGWFDQISSAKARPFSWLAALLVLVIFPLILWLITLTKTPIDHFRGGWYVASLVYSLWEQLTGLCIVITLLGVSRRAWNRSNPVLREASRAAFGAYIFHPLVLISLTLLLLEVPTDSVTKLLLVAPLAVVGSFLLVATLLRIPGVGKII